VSTLAVESPELKKLWIRVLKRVHPDLAVDDLDRSRCERLTQQANEAYARRDEVALRAVLKLNTLPPVEEREHGEHETPAGAADEPRAVSRRPGAISEREQTAILCGAGVVLCLLLYGILEALREEVGWSASLSLLAILSAGVLWRILGRPSSPHKTRWASAAAAAIILLGVCVLGIRPRANSVFLSAHAANVHSLADRVGWKDSANLPPSQWYWDVIKSRVGQSWNPSAVAGMPAGFTADIAFTIARDGSPQDVQLRRRSGSPSLDASCVLAVQQVKTFGPPEGGARDRMNVIYPCSYNELAMDTRAGQIAAIPLPGPFKPKDAPSGNPGALGNYIKAAKTKVTENWSSSEVTGTVPAGATVYIQFVIWPHGNHDVPMTETSSGYTSLDSSCLRAVERIKTFGRLPRGYDSNHMTMFYQCTYPGATAASSSPLDALDHAAESVPDSAVVE
jgi:TonB family protein